MEAFFRQGEFDHKVNNPFLNFVSAVLDITIIKPLYEAATGEDIITGEDLTDLEKGLKVVFACLDLITLGQAAGATDIADLGAKKALKVLGKAFAVEFASNATATAVASIGDELGLPVPITLLLSMVSGVTVSRAGTKLTIEGSTIKKELDISQDVIGKVDDTISIIDETGVGKINIEKNVDADNVFKDVGEELAEQSGNVKPIETSYGESSSILTKPNTTRINLANGRTRFTPLRESGNPVSAGMHHVIDGHFNRQLSNSRSIFTISVEDLKGILQRKSVIASPIIDLGNGQYKRVVDVGEIIGNTALKYGGKPTSWIEIITDVKGNIITTYPVPKP